MSGTVDLSVYTNTQMCAHTSKRQSASPYQEMQSTDKCTLASTWPPDLYCSP